MTVRRRRVAGALAALLALTAGTLAAFLPELPWANPWTIDVVVGDSTQITPGSPVRIAGVDIGEVRSVGRGPGTTAQLELSIDEAGRPLRTDATAAIRPRLFLEGSYYVALTSGTPSAPALRRGATLGLGQTSVPVSLTSVLSAFDRPVRDGLAQLLDETATGLGGGGAEGLGDGLDELGPAFRAGADAGQALLGRQPDDVSRLVAGAERVTAALADEAPALGEAISSGRQVADALADRENELTATLRELDTTLRAAPGDLVRVRRALPAARALARDLTPPLRIAPRPLRRAANLLGEVRGLAGERELPALTRVARRSARELTAFGPPLRRLLPRVRQVAGCVGDQGVAMLEAKLEDGRHTTGQHVWQELAHNGVNLGSLSQNFDAAGSYVRFVTVVQPRLLALGSVPGVGVLAQNATSGTFDARPAWNGPVPPAFRPEVPCETQPTSNFQAPKATADRTTRTARVRAGELPSIAELRRSFERRARAARRGG